MSDTDSIKTFEKKPESIDNAKKWLQENGHYEEWRLMQISSTIPYAIVDFANKKIMEKNGEHR